MRSEVIEVAPGVTIQLANLRVDRIKRNLRQPRQTFDENYLRDLAKSTKGGKLLQPITVKPDTEKGWYMLVGGECRWRAAKINGDTHIPAIIRSGDPDPFRSSLVENGRRQNLNTVDWAHAFKEAREAHGMSWAEIEECTGISIPHMSNMMKVLELSPRTQQWIREGKLPQTHALNLAQMKGKFSLSDKREIELAHAYMRGENPIEINPMIHDAHNKDRRIEGHMPTDPQALFRRILKLRYESRSFTMAIMRFLELPPPATYRVLNNIPATARENMRRDFTELGRVLTLMVKYLETHDKNDGIAASAPPRQTLPVTPVPSPMVPFDKNAGLTYAYVLAMQLAPQARSTHIGMNDQNLKKIFGKKTSEEARRALMEGLATIKRLWGKTTSNKNQRENHIIDEVNRLQNSWNIANSDHFLMEFRKRTGIENPLPHEETTA